MRSKSRPTMLLVWALFLVLVYLTPFWLVVGLTQPIVSFVLGALGINFFPLTSALSYLVVLGAIWLVSYLGLRTALGP